MSKMLSTFRGLYGSGPLHLIAIITALAVAGYAASIMASSSSRWDLLIWFLGAVLLHDLVLYPLYTVLDRVAQGRRPRAAVNHVRIPALLSGLLLMISAGLVFTRSPETYERKAGIAPDPYLERWLAITAALFLASGILYAVRARRSARG